MVYGESDAYLLKVDIQARIISLWANLLDFNSGKLSSMIYKVIHILSEQGKCKSNWLEKVKNVVTNNGYTKVWPSQSCLNKQ